MNKYQIEGELICILAVDSKNKMNLLIQLIIDFR